MDRDQLDSVLGASFICYLGVTVEGTLMGVPAICGFDRGTVDRHGSVASRSLLVFHPPPRLPTSTASFSPARFSNTASTTAAVTVYGTARLVANPVEDSLACVA
ncbi:pyridoxamine 5'-phosphate oxidase family protein [Streptomyces cellulosae]